MKTAVAILALLVLGLGGFIAYDRFYKPITGGTVSVPAKESPAVRKAPRGKVALKKPIETIEGKAKENTALPKDVVDDPNKHVVAATQAPSSLKPSTITTVVDAETGKLQTFIKEDPYPWFAIEPRGKLSLAYGYKYRLGLPADRTTELELQYELVRVKAFKLGSKARVDTDREGFAGVEFSYQW